MKNICCNICNHETTFIFEAKVLQKYEVKYFKCTNCNFIQTEHAYWLNEAYSSPIGLLDVGLLQRNIQLTEQVSKILDEVFFFNGIFLDYGGGYGIFVRLMRDKGYDFYLSEMYTQNLFAKYFELKDLGSNTNFTCLTAFEVFEHLTNPIIEIGEMFKLSDAIIFSTELQPTNVIKSADDWWYFVPESGQHISFYSWDALLQLANFFNCHLYSNKTTLHILSKKPLENNPFELNLIKSDSFIKKIKNKFFKLHDKQQVERESFLMKDFKYYKSKLFNDKI